MARIKKYADNLTQNLTYFQTFVTDTNPNSDYFRITEFKESFTGGKNGFLIEGSEYLKESTDIKIEILDVEGNPIYFEPGNGVPEYYEGLSKVVAVYIYEDTPIGNAKITVLGELKTYLDGDGITQPIPIEWAGIYNVKWERDFKVNRLLSNEDKVRFYVRPEVSITEIVKPIFSNVVAPKTQSGIINGISQVPAAGTILNNYTSPTTYILETVGNSFWTGSMVGTYLDTNLLVTDPADPNGSAAQPTIPYRPLVTQLINSREILVQPPYTEYGLVANTENATYTGIFNYTEGVDNLKTALTGSFAKITLADLTTFVGDCARVKIFRKSTADLSDFQFVQEIQLESNEILVDLASTTKNQENYGLFDNINFKEYWVTSSNDLHTSFEQSFLFDSIKLNSINGVQKFFTTKSLNINEGIEYSLNFNVRKEAIGNRSNYIEAYLSGSKQTIINGSPATLQVKQSIVRLDTENALLEKQIITENIKAEEINNARLYFDIKGFDWHIADVSLKASQETAFSPDEITFIQSVPRNLPVETFVYRFEFYDINNNYIPVLVEETKTFDGGNLQRIQKGLVFSPRSLTFQFDSGSQPVPPTVVGFTVTKNLLTGSVTYTSQSFDFFGDELFGSDYTASFTGQRYPGLLSDITSDSPIMTVGNFTGSRGDKLVQIVKITGEVEGYTDTVIFTKVLDGFGGVNYLIRPFRGTQIRNSSTSSLEIQAIRIDGVNDIQLSSTTQPYKGWPDKQLHIISRSADGAEKFVNLEYALSSSYIYGLNSGSLGSKELNYNAVFNRDSIDFRRTIYLISSQSAAAAPAFIASASVVASIQLEDLQDGLDSGIVKYNADSFTINPRTESEFRPAFGFATASFAKRGTAASEIESVTASFKVWPSMSINKDWVPEYWMYYTTQSCHTASITITAIDENRNPIYSKDKDGLGLSTKQSKNLTLTFTYTEPWTSASVSLDKTFTIVPEGKQGDESIVFEVTPISVTLGANSRGIVNDYKPSITDIKLKQGSKYLAFSSSAHVLDDLNTHGTFYIASASIIDTNITAGNIHFTSSFGTPGKQYTASLIISASSNMTDLSGSIEYPLIIHPYYTSSIYTASVIVNYTKILEGAPPIQILISPTSVALTADEVGYISPAEYSPANTTIQVKDGDDFLKLTTTESFTNADARKGTYTINSIQPSVSNGIFTILTGSFSQSMSSSKTGLTGRMNYDRFDYPYVSASALYTIQVYPYALGAGHLPTSSIYTRTQTFTKNVTPPKARSVDFKASTYTINYDRNGRVSAASEGGSELSATAFNTTSSLGKVHFYLFNDDGSQIEMKLGTGTPPSVTFDTPVSIVEVAPDEIKKFTVRITDGNPYTSPTLNPYRAEAQLTISGMKAGADSYKLVASNDNTSITADLWGPPVFSNTGMKITTFNGTQQLINQHPLPQASLFDANLDFAGNPIGMLGYSSASIIYKDNWITSPTSTTGNPAETGNITAWQAPAINTSGKIVYRVDFEGDSSTTNALIRPLARQTQFVTQSISVQFTPPAPYDVKMTNENSSAVYKVAGTLSFAGTGTQIRVYRGDTELVNTSTLPATDTDAYGTTGLSKDKCRISVQSYSSGIITLGGGLGATSPLPGTSGVTPATMPILAGWATPASNPTAEIVYKIECEGRATFFKTQSLSIQYEGNVGPGLVMRGEWDATKDYYGSVENINDRLDVVTYQATQDDTKYYAAISGSGPNTWVNPTTSTFYRGASPPAGFTFNVGAQAPTPSTTQVPPVAYWRYLGTQDFFVAAKLAIFEKSFVKNSINVGTKPGALDDFANIVINGGRTDPYIAMGQVGSTAGTAGTAGSSAAATGVIGYDKPGIFLGIYENGSSGTSGRFSIKTTSTSGKGMFWDGDVLTIIGAIRQIQPGVSEGSLRGAWTAGDTYYTNDIVSYGGQSWRCTSAQAENYQNIATNDTNALTGYPGSGPWAIAASAGTSGTSGALGATGGPGPGVVYRGEWKQYESDGTTAKTYYRDPAAPTLATRRDVVKGSNGQYYLCKVTHTTAVGSGGVSTKPITGVDYATYWESFGATFSSIATDILLAQDATVTRALVMGSDDDGIGIIRSVDATAFDAGAGFFMDKTGRARFGDPTENQIKFDGTNFEITGSINATDGQIGDWVIDATTRALRDTDSQIILDPNIPEIQFYTGSGAGRVKKVSISPVKALSSPSATPIILYLTGSYALPTPSITTTGGTATQQIKYSGYTTSGSVSDGVSNLGRYNVTELGFVQVTANIPTFEVETPPNSISHTTTFPSYFPQYSGQQHGGYSSPQTAIAYLYLEAVKVSDDSVVGQSYIGNSSSTGEYNAGDYYVEDYYSVTGDTLIINEFGESIYAKDVIVGQIITAWDWHSSFGKYKIENIKTKTVNKIFKVSAGGKEVKVSETHGFWLEGNAEIKVSDLIPGESKINIKDGNTIKLVIVDNVEIIESVQTVYTFVVPVANNYISNDIISHNPSYWTLTGTNTIAAVSNAFTGGEITTNIFLSATGLIRFRYAFYFYAEPGIAASLGATVDSYSTSYSNWTFDTFSTMTTLGDTMSVLAPANFVEINAGGLQVISDSDKYVRIPRRISGAAVGDLLKVFGGNIRTDNILPNDTGRTIGSSLEKYDYMYSAHYDGTPTLAATNGYTTLTNGIILQWGYQAYTTTATPVVFPITFPNAVYSVHVTTNRITSGANGYNHAGSLTTAGFSAVFDAVGGWWSAIGV